MRGPAAGPHLGHGAASKPFLYASHQPLPVRLGSCPGVVRSEQLVCPGGEMALVFLLVALAASAEGSQVSLP